MWATTITSDVETESYVDYDALTWCIPNRAIQAQILDIYGPRYPQLVRCVRQGGTPKHGCSTSDKRLRDAHARLKKRGVPLAVNQVNYSLIYRTPEENGVKAACDELGVTLIAYSPIAQG